VADPNVLAQPIVAAAWEGLKPDRVWDSHAHLFGNGQSGQGIWLHEDYERTFSMARQRRRFFEDAACGGADQQRLDQGIVERLRRLADDFPAGAKVVLLAFDFAHDESGKLRKDLTAFHIPNEYAARIARERPERFEWMASVHPYREDAVAALEAAKRDGARGIKWLPPAMGSIPRARAATRTTTPCAASTSRSSCTWAKNRR
jgi:mannonate dehydratase